jgi:hypothetical protein
MNVYKRFCAFLNVTCQYLWDEIYTKRSCGENSYDFGDK